MDNAASSDLQWLLLRKNNCKIVKRGGAGFLFSSEAGNVKNVHSYKYSGLVNDRIIDVSPSSSGVSISTRKVEEGNRRQIAGAQGSSKKLKSPAPRKAAGSASKLTKGYRDDLVKDTMTRAARTAATQRNMKSA